jgi:hypothetical protein
MPMSAWLCVLLVWAMCSAEAFRPRARLSRPRATSAALPAFDATLLVSAALDYSAEIEKAVQWSSNEAKRASAVLLYRQCSLLSIWYQARRSLPTTETKMTSS